MHSAKLLASASTRSCSEPRNLYGGTSATGKVGELCAVRLAISTASLKGGTDGTDSLRQLLDAHARGRPARHLSRNHLAFLFKAVQSSMATQKVGHREHRGGREEGGMTVREVIRSEERRVGKEGRS